MTARIKVDPSRSIGSVDPRIYGGFIEHVGRCIYGGILDEGSPLSDESGFRLDVMAAIRDLGITVVRWPGGLFANSYHWADGIGPREARPRRIDPAWRAEESNRFGTDEFLRYCRLVEAEAVICVNIGTGSLDEAAAWVEYCNGRGDTYWANRRRANGHDRPYDVKYWCLGNEAYNRQAIGTLTAEEYVRKAVELAKVMKSVDPQIQLIGSGLNGWSRWDRVVLEGLAPFLDFHSLHLYTGSPDYYSNVLAPHLAERALRVSAGVIEGVRYQQAIKHPIRVAYDEWNVWFRAGNPPWDQWAASDGGLEETYTLADALAVATYLNAFVRHCTTVRMANIAQLVNVLAPIVTRAEGLLRQAIFHPLALYSRNMHGQVLDTFVDGPMHELRFETSPWPHRVADMGPFHFLDVTAVRDQSGAINLAVVNRNLEHAVETTLEIPGPVRGLAYELNAPGVDSANSFDSPDCVKVVERSFEGSMYSFPAHSLTVMRLAQEAAS